MKPDDYQSAANSMMAYNRMTPEEKAKHDELVKQLDSMLTERRDRERRKNVVAIDFEDRRLGDRRK